MLRAFKRLLLVVSTPFLLELWKFAITPFPSTNMMTSTPYRPGLLFAVVVQLIMANGACGRGQNLLVLSYNRIQCSVDLTSQQ